MVSPRVKKGSSKMGVEYINIGSTNNLSEICVKVSAGCWWYCGVFLGRVVGQCLHV